jgi:hypothetical protein
MSVTGTSSEILKGAPDDSESYKLAIHFELFWRAGRTVFSHTLNDDAYATHGSLT